MSCPCVCCQARPGFWPAANLYTMWTHGVVFLRFWRQSPLRNLCQQWRPARPCLPTLSTLSMLTYKIRCNLGLTNLHVLNWLRSAIKVSSCSSFLLRLRTPYPPCPPSSSPLLTSPRIFNLRPHLQPMLTSYQPAAFVTSWTHWRHLLPMSFSRTCSYVTHHILGWEPKTFKTTSPCPL